jgi:hypothetical protein
MNEVKKITIQTRAPTGRDPGAVEEGYYCVADGFVVLTDADGKPIIGAPKRYLDPGGDARLDCLCIASPAAARPHHGVEVISSTPKLS